MAKKQGLQVGDAVIVNKGKYQGKHGPILEKKGGKAFVFLETGAGHCEKRYRLKDLTLVPPIEFDADALRALARFESQAIRGIADCSLYALKTEGRYQMTLEDLGAALEHALESQADDDVLRRWYTLVFQWFDDVFGIWEYIDAEAEEDEISHMPNAASVFADVQGELRNRCKCSAAEAVPLSELLEWVNIFFRDVGKPAIERELTHTQMRDFVQHWTNDRVMLEGDAEVEALYAKYVSSLAAADDPVGLHELAYACYGAGNAGFAQDWVRSRDCLLKLEELAPSSQYANTLGYIYYYGRCNDGVPEYEQAFYWFSLAAAGGNYEARYKIADMVKDGKGCHKDVEIANHAIWDLYNENVKYFCRGWGRTKFADIALRMGNLYRDGVGCAVDMNRAHRFYLMAYLAIRMRRQCCDAYGDVTVERNICAALEEAAEKSGHAKPKSKVKVYALEELLVFAMGYGRRVRMDYRLGKKGKLTLTFRMEDEPGTRYESKIPVCIPDAGFCGLLEQLVVTAQVRKPKLVGLSGKTGSIVFDKVGDEWPNHGAFMLFGQKVAHVQGPFTIDCRGLAGKLRRYASVSFGDPERCWDYLCDDDAVQVGTRVEVPWGTITRKGIVKRITLRYDSEVELWRKAYKWVPRTR